MFWICFDVSRGIGIKSCHSILALLGVVERAWCAPSLLHPQNTCIPKSRLVWFSILLGQIRSIICIIYRCLMVFVDMNDSLSLSRKIYNHIYIYISICRFTPFHYQIFIAVYIATSFNTNPRHCKASRLENCIWPMEIRRPCPLSGIPGKGTSTCHNKNWDGFWGLLLVDLVD